jgi:hypothetical protein
MAAILAMAAMHVLAHLLALLRGRVLPALAHLCLFCRPVFVRHRFPSSDIDSQRARISSRLAARCSSVIDSHWARRSSLVALSSASTGRLKAAMQVASRMSFLDIAERLLV